MIPTGAHVCRALALPVLPALLVPLDTVMTRLEISHEELHAYVEERKRRRAEQLEEEKKRWGEKQGVGITRRTLGPDGWEVVPSLNNMRTTMDEEHPAPSGPLEDEMQRELIEDRVSHEIAITCRDLAVFAITRRMLLGEEKSQEWLDQADDEIRVDVAMRLASRKRLK